MSHFTPDERRRLLLRLRKEHGEVHRRIRQVQETTLALHAVGKSRPLTEKETTHVRH